MKNYLYKPAGLLLAAAALYFLPVYIFKLFDYQHYNLTVLPAVIFIAAGAFYFIYFRQKEVFFEGAIYLLRFFIAYIFVFYALGKIYNLQFIVTPQILNTAAGKLDGFNKAWLFYSHSYTYGLFIAVAELLGALLLLFNTTRTAGALLSFFILVNITVMDFLYGVEAMKYPALLFTVMSLYLIITDGKRVLQFMFNKTANANNSPGILSKYAAIYWLIFFLLVVNEVAFFVSVT